MIQFAGVNERSHLVRAPVNDQWVAGQLVMVGVHDVSVLRFATSVALAVPLASSAERPADAVDIPRGVQLVVVAAAKADQRDPERCPSVNLDGEVVGVVTESNLLAQPLTREYRQWLCVVLR